MATAKQTTPDPETFIEGLEAPAFYRKFQSVLEAVKDPSKKSAGVHNKYADLGEHLDAIKPALKAHGLGMTQLFSDATFGVSGVVLVTQVFDPTSGFSIESRLNMTASLEASEHKQVFQGLGSGVTYCRRYALAAMFNLFAEDDDGANGGQRRAASQPAARTAPAENAPPRGDTKSAPAPAPHASESGSL